MNLTGLCGCDLCGEAMTPTERLNPHILPAMAGPVPSDLVGQRWVRVWLRCCWRCHARLKFARYLVHVRQTLSDWETAPRPIDGGMGEEGAA